MSGTEWHHEPPLQEEWTERSDPGFIADDSTTVGQAALLRDASWLIKIGVIKQLTIRGFVFGLDFEFLAAGQKYRQTLDEVQFAAFVKGVRASQAANSPTRH